MTGRASERFLKFLKKLLKGGISRKISLKREDAKELAPLGIIMKKLFSKQ